MNRNLLSEKQSKAALERALREGWITPEQVEDMLRAQREHSQPESDGGRVRRVLSRLWYRPWIRW